MNTNKALQQLADEAWRMLPDACKELMGKSLEKTWKESLIEDGKHLLQDANQYRQPALTGLLIVRPEIHKEYDELLDFLSLHNFNFERLEEAPLPAEQLNQKGE